ncbi:LysE family transporter [Emticicia fluvialis]|uniref:LysE family transporter n=1 Tax=Emticicia fluvialis TaxID=2974474 RepID=UPI0021659891|nr:LysE family transporter [Emticicia fluvialis]
MPEPLAILLLTALISFLGSVQPGPVNLAVVQATLSRSFKDGVYVAVSGSLPEVIYTIAALKGRLLLMQNQILLDALQLAAIPFFLITGLFSLFTKAKTTTAIKTTKIHKETLGGFGKGMLNPQLLPFWLVVLVYLHSFYSLQSFSSQLSFVLGAALGSFAILLLFAWLAKRFQGQLHGLFLRFSFNKAIGLLFISMAVGQTLRIFL